MKPQKGERLGNRERSGAHPALRRQRQQDFAMDLRAAWAKTVTSSERKGKEREGGGKGAKRKQLSVVET